MKSLMSLWRELALECASWCHTSATEDVKTVFRRVEDEGDSFLTITLPQYCKDFERGLELGKFDNNSFLAFRKRNGLPLFLGGFLCQVFDTSGSLLAEPSIDCISSIRQLTLVFGKVERPCSDTRVRRAMRQFVQVEVELEAFDFSSLEEFLPQFRKVSTLLWADVFSEVENDLIKQERQTSDFGSWDDMYGVSTTPPQSFSVAKRGTDPFLDMVMTGFRSPFARTWITEIEDLTMIQCDDVLVPRHGPGATADRLRGNAKFEVNEWPLRLESVFPYGDYALPSWRTYYQLDRVKFLEPGRERPVKVVPVPKTLKTPRIIAIEPTAVQYCQQALSHALVNRIQNRSELSHNHRGSKRCDFGAWFVGFKEQEPNRLLAREGSINAALATLDLSEASDRVLNRHVELLFSRFPRLSEAIQATRSTKADVPGHGVIPLVKFASMGSALCFPVEAMVFLTIVFTAIAHERREPLTRALFFELRGKVRVYGDDIIVPVEYVEPVIQLLEVFGLVVNKDKSFWNGKFRESCGGDYFHGEWVTPIRLRKDLPRSLADVDQVVALAAFRNLLYWGGFWKTASKLDARLNSLLKRHWSIVESTCDGLGRESALPYKAGVSTLSNRKSRIHSKLHTPLVKGAVVRYRTPDSKISGEGALLKFMLKRGLQPSQDAWHLERQGRPKAVDIKLRWIRPF